MKKETKNIETPPPALDEAKAGLNEIEQSGGGLREVHGYLAALFKSGNREVSSWARDALAAVLISVTDVPEEGAGPLDVSGYPDIREAKELIEAADAAEGRTSHEERKAVNCLIMDFFNSGDDEKKAWATETFILRNQPFIGKCIAKYFSTYARNWYDELFSAGQESMLKALPRFNPRVSGSGSVTTYFTYPVIHGIYAGIAEEVDRTNPYYKGLVKKVNQAVEKLAAKGSETPKPYQIASAAGLCIGQVDAAMKVMNQSASVSLEEIDGVVGASGRGSDPFSEAVETELRDAVDLAVRELDQLTRDCLILKFGLGTGVEMTEHAIAERLGIKQSQVGDIVQKGYDMLRHSERIRNLEYDGVPRQRCAAVRKYDDDLISEMFDDIFD